MIWPVGSGFAEELFVDDADLVLVNHDGRSDHEAETEERKRQHDQRATTGGGQVKNEGRAERDDREHHEE